jgi:hypothetical protein
MFKGILERSLSGGIYLLAVRDAGSRTYWICHHTRPNVLGCNNSCPPIENTSLTIFLTQLPALPSYL